MSGPESPVVIINLHANDLHADALADASEHLVDELNEHHQIANLDSRHGSEGAKGLEVDIGQIALSLASASILKYVAQTLIAFIKRNNRLTIQIGNVKFSKDNASANDLAFMVDALEKLQSEKKSKRAREQKAGALGRKKT
jgi:hypothetical protein